MATVALSGSGGGSFTVYELTATRASQRTDNPATTASYTIPTNSYGVIFYSAILCTAKYINTSTSAEKAMGANLFISYSMFGDLAYVVNLMDNSLNFSSTSTHIAGGVNNEAVPASELIYIPAGAVVSARLTNTAENVAGIQSSFTGSTIGSTQIYIFSN